MKRFLVILFGLLVLIFGYFYFFFGLREYLTAHYRIRQLPQEQREATRQKFLSLDGNSNREYGGIWAGVTRIGNPLFWVWGRSGLRHFRPDEFSVYSYFSMCSEENMARVINKESVKVGRSVTNEMDVWLRKIKAGEYVVVMVALEGNGGTLGNLREVYGHDWWVFISSDIKKICEK